MDNGSSALRLLDCAVLSEERLFQALFLQMNPRRREKIQAAPNDTEKLLSLGAGCLIELLLREHSIPPSALRCRPDGAPELDAPMYLSVSHSGRYALVGLSECPLGVDIEAWDPSLLHIADHFFTAEEQAFLTMSPAPVPDFFRLWCRKEAVMKRDGIRELRSFSVLVPQQGCRFWEYPFDGYSCVAYCSSAIKLPLQQVTEDALRTLLPTV